MFIKRKKLLAVRHPLLEMLSPADASEELVYPTQGAVRQYGGENGRRSLWNENPEDTTLGNGLEEGEEPEA